MPGSATLGTNLVDSLLTLVDSLRQDIAVGFGLRQFRVWTVRRTYPSGEIGEGSYTDTETELTPRPEVLPWTSKLDRSLEPCGIDESGFVSLRKVSLTYTEAQLTGGTLGAGVDWLFKITEGESQAQTTRYFTLSRPPYPDRIKEFGWQVELARATDGET